MRLSSNELEALLVNEELADQVWMLWGCQADFGRRSDVGVVIDRYFFCNMPVS